MLWSSNSKDGILYTKSHEYVKSAGEGGVLTCGVSEHAVELLGEVVFVELPAVGDVFPKGGVIATVESVKAASDVYTPVAGKIVAVNSALEESPDLVSNDPLGEGWIVKMEPTEDLSSANLMDFAAYQEFYEGE